MEQGELNFDTPDPSPSLIQPERARAVTEDAIYRATFLTGEDRKQQYFEAIVEAARRHLYFTADQVWEILGGVGDGKRDNGSALGPVMREAMTAGIMKRSGNTQTSDRPSMHKKHITLWESLVIPVVLLIEE